QTRYRQSHETSLEHSDAHVAEARWSRAVSGADNLRGLALTAIGRAPQTPMFFVRDRVAGIPELRRDAAVGAVSKQLPQLPFLYFVSALRAELEIEAHIIDAPGPIRVHEHAFICVCDDVVQFPIAGLRRNVRHANERYSVPAGGSHAAVT